MSLPDLKTSGKRVLVVAFLVLAVTLLHYVTGREEAVLHVVYRDLYFLPIIMAGFWFGIRGGLAASLSSTVLYLPVLIMHPSGFAGHDLGNFLALVLFNISGALIGWLRDRETLHQEALRKAENLAVMGQAVSSIAHDMKTPLIVIGGYIKRIRRKLPQDDASAEGLDIALHQTARLELMVKDMLAFAKPLKLELEEVDPNSLVDGIVKMSNEYARSKDVSLRVALTSSIPPIAIDVHRLEQVLQNLINNAIEATPQGGEVTISTGKVAEGILIAVADQGEGIPPDRARDIFQPFITTKKEGTGLGLPIAKKIAEAHGGAIDFREDEFAGTVFQLCLPCQKC